MSPRLKASSLKMRQPPRGGLLWLLRDADCTHCFLPAQSASLVCSPQFTSWPLPPSALPLLRSSSRDNTLTGQLGVIRMCNYEVAGGDMSSKRMVLAPTSVQTELVSRPCMGLRNCRKREGLGDGPDAIGLLARSTMQVHVVADNAATGRPRLDHSEMLFMPRQLRPFWGPSPTEHITSSLSYLCREPGRSSMYAVHATLIIPAARMCWLPRRHGGRLDGRLAPGFQLGWLLSRTRGVG